MISIIVPVYNIEPYIERCVDSVLAQTYVDWELILIDDGSTDGSAQVCDEQVERDARIIVLHKENQGVALARRDGVMCAKGEWIMFLDGDDTIVHDALEYLLSCNNGMFDIIGASFIRVLSNKEIPLKFEAQGEFSSLDYIEAILLNRTSIGCCAKLINRKLFNNFKFDVPSCVIQNEDLLMMIYLSTKAKCVYLSNKPIYNYICRENSASQSRIMILDGWRYIFNMISELIMIYNNEKINYAFIHYRLICFRNNIILKGVKITGREDVVFNVINASKKYLNLLDEDKFVLSLLTSKQKREFYYLYNKVKTYIKIFIKKIIVNKFA